MSFNPLFTPGLRIRGKWNGGQYRIERALGEGANGKVYLVSRDQALYAMKVGADAVDMQAEVNVLQALSKTEGSFRRFLTDVDDFQENGTTYPFYIMRYVKGLQLQEYLQKKGVDWFPLIGMRILEKLEELHGMGWIFCDLKKENILVSGYGDVELVDFGGVTPKGRAVKQFTEIYDRGHWDAGTRSADEAYDLFSFGILCVQMCGGSIASLEKHVLPQNRNAGALLEEARRSPGCASFLPFLEKALYGKFASASEACADWKRLLQTRRGSKRPQGADQVPAFWLKAGFIASLVLFIAALYYHLKNL